jgi:UDP-glucose 4-epimerase
MLIMEQRQLSCTLLGANGYIGRHLAYYLNQKGFKVFAYDIQAERNPNIPDTVPYEQFDICNNYEHIKLDVDYLFVFSGITGTKNGFDNYRTFIEVNEIGLLNILSKVKDMGIKPKIIFPSTRLVYKGEDYPLPESAEKEAKTIYAANKIACEQYLKMYANCFDIKYTVYRICVPYGNQFDGEFSYGTVGAFLNRAKSGGTITLYGDGSIKRTLTHVMSICQQIADSMILAESDNNIYNIAGETFSLKEIAERIASVYNTPVTFIPWNEMDWKIESKSTVFDGTAIENIISFFPQWSFAIWLNGIL